MNKQNILSDLEINEVSLVDKGAIGEIFTIIKAENFKNSDLVVQFINKLSNQEFVEVMNQMIERYNEINNNEVNKGGIDMNEEIKKLFEDFMETVNKNFKAVYEEIAEIKKVSETEKAEKEVNDNEVLKDAKDKETDKLTEIEERVSKLSDSLEKITQSLSKIDKVKESVDKLSEMNLNDTISDLKKRLETIESQDLGSNQLKDEVNKSEETKSAPFWKSFFTLSENETIND
jgi:uncharacterized coiled-coil DUF342 family protein